jgi:hypothetical protein
MSCKRSINSIIYPNQTPCMVTNTWHYFTSGPLQRNLHWALRNSLCRCSRSCGWKYYHSSRRYSYFSYGGNTVQALESFLLLKVSGFHWCSFRLFVSTVVYMSITYNRKSFPELWRKETPSRIETDANFRSFGIRQFNYLATWNSTRNIIKNL